MRSLAEFDTGDHPVSWSFDGDEHEVTYGKQVKRFTCDMEACHEFGECVRHSLECVGELDKQ